ncbi:MAG: DUF1697 domain-containing protein [Mycobacterium sp.]|uniref:DUF1697 domain-containing protein n=1 Tax=Mycobacterium sp. TaxID=1785 RepID=UPI0026128570|nr:DUF1697 domain-containing protein [Mycobacterium sp.]MDI3314110.1 DUF1697 domain-containing protein [Mycobacterium sp.]
MNRYAAFLRGVNVGGVNLKMAEVSTALADAGFAEVRTILASGNVVLESDVSAAAVRAKAEAAVHDELAALAARAGPDEKIGSGDGVIYWQVPKGGTLDSAVGKTMGKQRYKSSTTTRNLRTLAKVLR